MGRKINLRGLFRYVPLIVFGLVIPALLISYPAWNYRLLESDYITVEDYTFFKHKGVRIAYLEDYPNPYEPFAPPLVKSNPDAYKVPEAFVLVNSDSGRLMVSENYALEDFVRDESLPIYIALKKSLVKKLEALALLLRQEGILRKRITIISGFRSPAYTKRCLLNENTLKTRFSRHQYGDAVDIIIDDNQDGVMDDLNKDDIIDVKDAIFLRYYVRRVEQAGCERGGLGFYSNHDIPGRPDSPYVHFDCRGYGVPE